MAPAPFNTFSRAGENASARSSMCRWSTARTPKSWNSVRYSVHTSSTCSVATVATTSFDPLHRLATARRISLSPFLSSRPPMITSEPAFFPDSLGSMGNCSIVNFGSGVAASRAGWRRCRLAPGACLVLFATQHHQPVRLLEECWTRVYVAVLHQHGAAGDEVDGLQCATAQCEDVSVIAALEPSLCGQLQYARRIGRRERKNALERPALVHAVGQLLNQRAGAGAARVRRDRETSELAVVLDVAVERGRKFAIRRVDVDKGAAVRQRSGFAQEFARARHVRRVNRGGIHVEVVKDRAHRRKPRSALSHMNVRDARFPTEKSAHVGFRNRGCQLVDHRLNRSTIRNGDLTGANDPIDEQEIVSE